MILPPKGTPVRIVLKARCFFAVTCRVIEIRKGMVKLDAFQRPVPIQKILSWERA